MILFSSKFLSKRRHALDCSKSLICEIEDKPVLWNVFSDEYRDRVKKSEAWREVAAKLQRDQTEVSVTRFTVIRLV